MKRLDALLFALLVLLAVGVAVEGARVADRYQVGGAWRAEVGRTKLTELDPAMEERLQGLSDDLVFTYYVSARHLMPSAMKRIERDVTDLLGAFQAAAPDRVDFHIVDPETDREQLGYATNRRITRFRVRDVAHDAWTERLIWSTLTMSYGAREEVIVNGVTPERLSRLQATLVEHLDRLDSPRRPKLALAAPPGFRELAGALAEYGDVVEVDLDGGDAFPTEADILFWMQPTEVTAARLRELERTLELGRSVVVAGSLLRVPVEGIAQGGPELTIQVERANGGAGETGALEPLLAHFGLRVDPAFVLDVRAEAFMQGEEQIPAPFLVRCIAPNQNFVTWRNQPNGTLLFHAPTPLRLQPEVLQDLGFEARVLATTSDDTWLQEPPIDAARPFSELAVEYGNPVSKLPLLVALEPSDPWRGRFVAMGATTAFEDGSYARPGTAHWRLLRTIVDELAAPERLVAAAVAEVDRPAPAPTLSGAARLFWRALVIGLVPLAFLVLAVARGAFRGSTTTRRATTGLGPAWMRVALALAVALVLARLSELPRLRADATADGANSLAVETQDIAARAGEAGTTQVELIFSGRDKMPPAMKSRVARVRTTLDDFERAGADFDVRRVDVDGLDDSARSELASAGIKPVHVTTRDDEVTTVRTIYSAVRLERDGRVEVLPFDDAAAFEFLEFRLAFALWRLETGRRPTVAFAADAERMSAAEDFDIQQKGMFAPKGNDPYSLARALLHRLDFDVVNVTPRQFVQSRKPEVPRDADLVIWMQPRRSITQMMEETVRYLHGGGNVLLFAQHFKILSRQYRGREFQMSYWPRPQSTDVQDVYLPELGVHMVRDVLFDELFTELMVDTELIGRKGGEDYERQLSVREFQLRVSAANFNTEHPITANLGDQAFIWGNRIELDEARLAELGLEATVLMTTTARTWTFPWKGGFLEEGAENAAEHIEGPPPGDSGPAYLGPLPLAVLVEGQFPRPAKPLTVTLGAETEPFDPNALEGYPEPEPGQLMLVGCSSAFQDDRLHLPDFRGDHLLLNSVAHLALEPELAAIAMKHPVVRGFGLVGPEQKLRWRSFVVAAPPLGLLVLGALVVAARRRKPTRRSA